MPPRRERARGVIPRPGPEVNRHQALDTRMVADAWDCGCCTTDPRRRAALDRLHEQQQAIRIATALDQLAPLARYYRRRRAA
jgi:hypothetical protein